MMLFLIPCISWTRNLECCGKHFLTSVSSDGIASNVVHDHCQIVSDAQCHKCFLSFIDQNTPKIRVQFTLEHFSTVCSVQYGREEGEFSAYVGQREKHTTMSKCRGSLGEKLLKPPTKVSKFQDKWF
jgi:hypothetical protein